LEELLYLFSETEIFIFVFMEIMTRIDITRRMMQNRSSILDKIVMILLFGGFSIFGTYIGFKLPSGAVSNVRDFGPMVAGLIGGPVVGLGAGLIGGVHRFFYGGFTNIACGVATINAGLVCGLVHYFRKGRLINIYQGAILAIAVEIFHAIFVLLIARPLPEAIEVTREVIPPMMIANALGLVIAILLLQPHHEVNLITSKEHQEGEHE
jgi:sigma-B regulation protein RsbU (phosphoserine phosphatase)